MKILSRLLSRRSSPPFADKKLKKLIELLDSQDTDDIARLIFEEYTRVVPANKAYLSTYETLSDESKNAWRHIAIVLIEHFRGLVYKAGAGKSIEELSKGLW